MDAVNVNTFIALASAILGGGVVKMVEVILVAKHGSRDYAATIREELRQAANDLKGDVVLLEGKIDGLQKERDEWKDKYYNLLIESKINDR